MVNLWQLGQPAVMSLCTIKISRWHTSPPHPPQNYTLNPIQLLTKANGTHTVFVTSLCFLKLPSSSTSNCDNKVIVLSVSADKTCSITTVPSAASTGEYFGHDEISHLYTCVSLGSVFYIFLSLLAVMVVLIALLLWWIWCYCCIFVVLNYNEIYNCMKYTIW